jgi:predicted PurR-regulated permease PerM
VPFFGTLLSTTLPALFVLTGMGYHGFSPVGHALLVVMLGVVVHLIEGNIVSPLVMSKKVDLPPVLTIMSVLVIGKLLGPLGLIVALPTLAALMVIVRRILITRIYEGQGFRRTTRERPVVLRVPAPGGGVIVPPGTSFDVVTAAERSGARRSA